MMKKLFLIIIFSFTYLIIPAQQWSIYYTGDNPEGRIHFHDGFIDEDGVTFLAGQEGPDADSPEALFMRIEPDGSHSEYKYSKPGFLSKATCIIEMPNQKLFAAGNLYGEAEDFLMVFIFDKHLNLIEEKVYGKEVEGDAFGECKATLDSHGHVIVSTYITQNNAYQGLDYRGVFFKFNHYGDVITCRYLIEEYPDPLYYLSDFRLRQMWYRPNEEKLLCLAPGFGNLLAFISFDSAFNYIDEYQIWQDDIDKSDHTLSRDCYTDYWYNEDEALFFSSRGDADHNKLRVSRVNTHGEILEFIHLNERADTIDDAAQPRCMASANDSTFYFSFYYHTQSYYPGTACIYLLNNRLEIVGRHVDDDLDCYRSCLVFASADGGCITVNDSCNYYSITSRTHPIIKKLGMDDFEVLPLSITHDAKQDPATGKALPNPCDETLHIPLPDIDRHNVRCQVYDHLGRIVIDRIVQHKGLLKLDVSRLKTGVYHYRLYTDRETLITEKFIKK